MTGKRCSQSWSYINGFSDIQVRCAAMMRRPHTYTCDDADANPQRDAADRIRAIVGTHDCKMLPGHNCDIVGVEVRADDAPGLAVPWDRPAVISVSGIPVRRSPARSTSAVTASTMPTPPFKGQA
jgi:hypothetical protein